MGSVLENGRPIKLNGAIFIMCGILKFVVTSAAEAELAALFINAKEDKIIRMTLKELATSNHLHPCIATTLKPHALPTTRSINSNHEAWK